MVLINVQYEIEYTEIYAHHNEYLFKLPLQNSFCITCTYA